METLSAKLLSKARIAIQEARGQLQNNDTVLTFSVCNKSYDASCFMLSAWLEEKGVAYDYGSSLPELVKLCRKYDPIFENFDFEGFSCVKMSEKNENCCDDEKKVSGCLEMTERLHEFIKKETVLGN